MLKAGALFIAIVVAVVIGFLSSSLILVAYHYRLQVVRALAYKRLEDNAASGIALLMADRETAYPEGTVADLFGEQNDSVALRRMDWGAFEVALAKAFSGDRHVTKAAQYGYPPTGPGGAALYLADAGSPLVVSGSTTLRGLCYLPEAGVRSGYIDNQPFAGRSLVDGALRKSTTTLPSLNTRVIGAIRTLLRTGGGVAEAVPADTGTVSRSFLEPTLVIRHRAPLYLTGRYRGNIIISSDTVVRIAGHAELNDVIVLAPDVRIEQGFTGTVQVFATDTLAVAEACRLNYPSVLGLVKEANRGRQAVLTLGKSAVLSGMAFTVQADGDAGQTLLRLEEHSRVEGQVYAAGYAELKGSVWGGVICRKLLLKTPVSVFENCLLNSSIDNGKRSAYYVGPVLLPSEKGGKVVKWLE